MRLQNPPRQPALCSELTPTFSVPAEAKRKKWSPVSTQQKRILKDALHFQEGPHSATLGTQLVPAIRTEMDSIRKKEKDEELVWRLASIVTTLEILRHEDCYKSQASLGYLVSFRLAWVIVYNLEVRDGGREREREERESRERRNNQVIWQSALDKLTSLQ